MVKSLDQEFRLSDYKLQKGKGNFKINSKDYDEAVMYALTASVVVVLIL